MKIIHKIILKALFIILCVSISIHSEANNLRQISNREGISNNAVLSLNQDKNGYIWVGTCDGLNMWDGTRMHLFPSDWGLTQELSGNLIERIISTEDGYFWICSNYGLDLLDPISRNLETHSELQGFMQFTASSKDKVIVLTADGTWHYYNSSSKRFEKADTPVNIPYELCYHLLLDENDVLSVYTIDGMYYFDVEYNTDGAPTFTPIEKSLNINRLKHITSAKGEVFIIDEFYSLYTYDNISGTLSHIKDLSKDIQQHGNISHIIRDGEDFLISFYTNGAICLKHQPENPTERYIIEDVGIKCGVFQMLKDDNQDIIWFATDGQGLYAYTKGSTAFLSITHNDLPYQLSKPIRDLHIDKNDDLWIATKGEGILRITDFYNQNNFTPDNTSHYTTGNSPLMHNSVYAFAESSHDIIWIGHEDDGLNYYSYADNRIHAIATHPDIRNVHDIYESSANTLWLATGNGAYRLTLEGSDNDLHVTESIRVDFGEGMSERNLFFSIYPDKDNIIWFTNRGGGAIKYNITTGEYTIHQSTGKALHNDVFSLYRSSNDLVWLATGDGVIYTDASTPAPTIQGATHGILEDSNGNIWISTNRGLAKYDQENNSLVTYGYSYGLHIIEYSDGAYFADYKHDKLLFGGINGFVVVSETDYIEQPYHPAINFSSITINDMVLSTNQLLSEDNVLVIQPDQTNFTLDISALDYINGSNYSYFFRIEGYSDTWQSTESLLTLKDLPEGTYTLEVKYYNNFTSEYSPVYSIKIQILAYWWASNTAKVFYLLFAITLLCIAAYLIIHRYRLRRAEQLKRLEAQRREQQYESKLNLFSNLTHELSIPLTMISAPCQLIISEEESNSSSQNHARTIQQNVAKMQSLLHMLHQFHGESVTDKRYNIELVEIPELVGRIIDMFTAFAKQNNVRYNIDISPSLIWPTDRNGLSTIVNNLLSSAFKHTPYNGEVNLKIYSKNDLLHISVANDSKGVDMKDIDAIFDHYRVLDYFEKKSRQGLSITGDLALAICHSITERLNGKISVESIPNATTTFFVQLPRLKQNEQNTTESAIVTEGPEYGLPMRTELKQYPFDAKRQTMVIIDDNVDIMSLIADMFSEEFNIKIFNSVDGVIELMKQMHPDIIVGTLLIRDSDIMGFIRHIKQNKLTSHIPIVLLSTPPQMESRIEALEAGVDLCLTLPFNTDYMKASIKQLLRRDSQLKDYYKSSVSAFELTNGKMLHKDDIEFIDKMISIISNNLTNNDISTAFIAREMGVSVRNLYRRIESSLQQTPSNIIKEYRLATAEHLLTTTKLSIDEIIYKAGFVNRGTFFRSFSAKYGVTPKVYRTQKLSGIEKISK